MKYSEVKDGQVFIIEDSPNYPKRKIGDGHIDIRDGCRCKFGNPDWDVELIDEQDAIK